MITDRTQTDVDNAKTLRDTKVKTFETLTTAEIEQLERGMLTSTTLNRIELKQAELKGLLNEAGYWNTHITNKAWYNEDMFFSEEWQRILDNEDILKAAYFTYTDTPQTPNTRLDYINLNAVEKILDDLENMINSMKFYYRQCGTFECGGERS